jgi:hypothetical protein
MSKGKVMVHWHKSIGLTSHGITPEPGKQFKKITDGAPVHGLMITCLKEYSECFFQESIGCTGKVFICPKVKLLMGLKILAHVSPTAFQDYFQMGITTAHACLKKLCKITFNNDHLLQKKFS